MKKLVSGQMKRQHTHTQMENIKSSFRENEQNFEQNLEKIIGFSLTGAKFGIFSGHVGKKMNINLSRTLENRSVSHLQAAKLEKVSGHV